MSFKEGRYRLPQWDSEMFFFRKQYYNYVHFLRVFEARLLLIAPQRMCCSSEVVGAPATIPGFQVRLPAVHPWSILASSNDEGNVIGPPYTVLLHVQRRISLIKQKIKKNIKTQKTTGGLYHERDSVWAFPQKCTISVYLFKNKYLIKVI